jgi:hypothetical protein
MCGSNVGGMWRSSGMCACGMWQHVACGNQHVACSAGISAALLKTANISQQCGSQHVAIITMCACGMWRNGVWRNDVTGVWRGGNNGVTSPMRISMWQCGNVACGEMWHAHGRGMWHVALAAVMA